MTLQWWDHRRWKRGCKGGKWGLEGGVGRFVNGFEKKRAQKKVTIILKPPEMK
jgi:hypothetical protein